MDYCTPTIVMLIFASVSSVAGDRLNVTQILHHGRIPETGQRARGTSTSYVRPTTSKAIWESFEGDFIFWGLKVRGFLLHQTYAYYSHLPMSATGERFDKNLLFATSLNGEIWALAVDYYAKRLYYTDHVRNFIGIYDLKTRKTTKLFRGMSWGIDSLSVDWVSGNVYWSDSNYDKIMIADRNFTNYRPLFAIESRPPAKVVVHPAQRYIYWTEKRDRDCRIYRSTTDGYSKRLMYSFPEVQTITDIVIDFVNNKMYWAERLRTRGGIGRIRYISLKGNSRTRATVNELYKEKSTYFFGLASYKNHLYVSDDHGKQLLVIDKVTKEVVYRKDFDYSEVPRGIAVFSAAEYPTSSTDQTHQCSRKGTCEQLCLAGYGTNQFNCECTMGFTLQPDGRSCRARVISDRFAILLDAKHAKMYQLNLAHPVEPQEIQVVNLARPISVAFDGINQTVIWADETSRTISKASLQGRDQRTLVENTQAFSIALDVESRNMYWVDAEKDTMFVSNLDGEHVRTLHVEGLHRVWAMVIDTAGGYLYWSDWGQVGTDGLRHGVIKSSRLDGSDVQVIATPRSTPHGLTVKPDSQILFWTQISENAIGWLNMKDGTVGRYKLPLFLQTITGIPFPTGIAYWQGYLYVTDLSKKHVLRVSVADVTKAINQTGTEREVRPFGPKIFYELAGIHIYDSAFSTRIGSTVCANSHCPHLCLPSHDGNRVAPRCVCQDHFKYFESNNSCLQETSTNDTTSPTFGDTCPLDMDVYTDECSNEAEISFVQPTATDDSNLDVTIKADVKITKLPMLMSEGSRLFTYHAVDRSHNTAKCSFRVHVIVRRCYSISLKDIPDDAELGETSCGDKVGSVVNVTCPGISGIAYQYECTESRQWAAIGPETCNPLAFKEPTSGSKSSTSAESSEAATSTSAAQSSDILTKISTSESLSMSTRTHHRHNHAMSTSEGMISSSDKGIHGKVTGKMSYDSTGLTVGLVVSFLVLIALGVAAFVIVRQRKAKGFTPGSNWNRADDRVQLTGGNTENGIYLGEADSPSPFATPNDRIVL